MPKKGYDSVTMKKELKERLMTHSERLGLTPAGFIELILDRHYPEEEVQDV